MQGINSFIKKNQKRIVFADGEDENSLKAAIAFKNSKLGIPILVGKESKIKEQIKNIGYSENFDIEIVNSKDEEKRKRYVKHLFEKLQREQGLLERDCDRMIRNDRVVWATSLVACGDADGAVTGNTRRFGASFEKIKQVVDVRKGEIMFGLNMIVHKGRTIFVGDTSVHEYPTSEQMAEIAISTARVVRLFGFDPKVAFVSHSTFGQPLTSRTKHIRNAVEILKERKVDFEFDGDMQPDVALNPEYEELYPFAKIVGKANILIMPGQHSAAISYKLMKTIGDTKVIGPLLIGLGLPIEIAPLDYEMDDSSRKELSSVPISEIDFPKVVYMVVDKKIELEIKLLKDFPEWNFLPKDDLSRKAIEIFFDLNLAKRSCNKEQKVLKVPNTDVFRIASPVLIAKGISRIVCAENLIAL